MFKNLFTKAKAKVAVIVTLTALLAAPTTGYALTQSEVLQIQTLQLQLFIANQTIVLNAALTQARVARQNGNPQRSRRLRALATANFITALNNFNVFQANALNNFNTQPGSPFQISI
jgi:hypothetical protein